MTLKFSLQIGRVLFWLLLLLAALGVHSCNQGLQHLTDRMSSAAPTPRSEAVALLPVAYLMPTAPKALRQFVQVLDTGRAGGPAHLHRKANPRNRWLPAQPAYFPRLPGRPPQHVLDSLAAASMRRA